MQTAFSGVVMAAIVGAIFNRKLENFKTKLFLHQALWEKKSLVYQETFMKLHPLKVIIEEITYHLSTVWAIESGAAHKALKKAKLENLDQENSK